MDKKILSKLEQLNLPSNEAKVYLALLKVGQTSAGELIKTTELHRSVVYETLDKLIARKLVFKITKQNIAYFQALSPDRLLVDIEAQRDLATSLLPQLKDFIGKQLPEIIVHEGPEAYKRFWLDSVKNMPVGTTDYVAGSIGSLWLKYMGKAGADQYFKIASQRKITWKLIVFDKADYDEVFLKDYPDFGWKAHWINKPAVKEGNFNIFGKDTLILHSATEPMIIEIRNESLVRVFQNLFDILWDTGKKLK